MSRVFEAIKSLLNSKGTPYELLEHAPVYTSEQAAQVRGTELKQGAKAIVFLADGKGILLVVAADRRIDTKSFKKLYAVKDLRMATPEEVARMTGLQIGSIPPFGNVLNLSTYIDESVTENQTIAFNAGSHTTSVLMSSRDFLNIVQPVVGRFAR